MAKLKTDIRMTVHPNSIEKAIQEHLERNGPATWIDVYEAIELKWSMPHDCTLFSKVFGELVESKQVKVIDLKTKAGPKYKWVKPREKAPRPTPENQVDE